VGIQIRYEWFLNIVLIDYCGFFGASDCSESRCHRIIIETAGEGMSCRCVSTGIGVWCDGW
jgi:hypothetical protein